jgi:hypothetical protein
MYVYATEQELPNATFSDFATTKPIWRQDSIVFGDWSGGEGDGSYSTDLELAVPEVRVPCSPLSGRRSRTTHRGSSMHSWWPARISFCTLRNVPMLCLPDPPAIIRHAPLPRSGRRLVTWPQDEQPAPDPADLGPPPIVGTLHPNVTLSAVYLDANMSPLMLPTDSAKNIHLPSCCFAFVFS